MRYDYDRRDFVEATTLGHKECIEYLSILRDEILYKIHSPIDRDPNGLESIRDMAKLEFIQTLIDKSKNIINKTGVNNDGTTSNGQPSI